jgi:uncharacterized protein YjbI with pentapeptide repeats
MPKINWLSLSFMSDYPDFFVMDGANLTVANLSNYILKNCQLIGKNLQSAHLGNAIIDDANLGEVNWQYTNLINVKFTLLG